MEGIIALCYTKSSDLFAKNVRSFDCLPQISLEKASCMSILSESFAVSGVFAHEVLIFGF
jgi:hypothetical protein